MKKIPFILTLLLLISFASSHAQTVIDGNFTNATAGAYAFNNILPNPSTNGNYLDHTGTNGWFVSANTVNVVDGTPADYVVLNSLVSLLGSAGAISETVTGLTPGTNYQLSFEAAAPGISLSLLNGSGVSVSATNATNTGTSNPFSGVATVSVNNFSNAAQQTFNFTATSTASTITFTEPGSVAQLALGGGYAVSGISIGLASVPEPKVTMSLIILFLLGLMLARAGLRQKASLTAVGEIFGGSV